MRPFYIVLLASTLGLFTQTDGLAQSQVNWMSLEEAVVAQKNEPRKIVMDVYTQWCGPCKMMMANTFTNPDVIAYLNENFYAVKFDAESKAPVNFKGQTFENPGYKEGVRGRNSAHQLSRELRVNAYPTLVYFDEKAEVIAPISGYKTPGQLEMYLKFFAQHFTPGVQQGEWEEFRDNFVPSFR
jgi:thioredoxin-related protein